MKITVRQLRGRPGVDNWHPLMHQLKDIGISKFLIDVSTDNLDDFFTHVKKTYSNYFLFCFLFYSGENCWINWSIL